MFLNHIGVITVARLFPSDFLHTLNQGLVQYILGWTLQMVYIIPLLDPEYKNLPATVTKLAQEFPAHNSFQPIRHYRFDDITSLIKQEKKVLRSSDISFDQTGIIALTETWKLMTALYQLLFIISTGNVFPSDLQWGKTHGTGDVLYNVERCFINAIVGCIEIYWYANAPNLTENQIETYRNVVSNGQSHLVVLHHVRMLIINKISSMCFANKQVAEAKKNKRKDDIEITEGLQ